MGKSLAIIFSILLLIFTVCYQVYTSYTLNDNTWIYPLDDTYIHMSIAKNLANEGQWGITRHEFSSSSSSILYTLLIALCFKLAGTNEYLPLFLNIIFGISLFIILLVIASKEKTKPLALLIISLLVLYLTPLPSLILSGMEHTLQILIDLIFIYVAARALESKTEQRKFLVPMLIFSALSVMIRFEGIFIVGVVTFLFLLKKEWKASLLVLLLGFVPLLIFGIYSVKNGSYFIPNSLLMKGEKPSMNVHGLIQFAFGWLDKLKRNPHLLTLFLGLCSYYIHLRLNKYSVWSRTSMISAIVVLTLIIHLTLAKTGWFFRYEAYLVFLGIFAFMWQLSDQIKFFIFKSESIWLYVATGILLMPFLYPLYARGKDALLTSVPATKNIYEQQYQMAKFLKKYYNTASVGANDIGAICFYTDIKLFDIFGLGSKEIIDLRIKKMFDQEHIHSIAIEKKTEVVIIYEEWFIGKVPQHWEKAGAWKISDNVILGGDKVSFFATEIYDPKMLNKNLREFSRHLPVGVEVLVP